MSPAYADFCTDTIICHCLRVTESTVVDAIDMGRLQTIREVVRETRAGEGCTACHGRIRCLLRAQTIMAV